MTQDKRPLAVNLPTIDRALSVRQPWAHALVSDTKDVENRSRATKHRGWVWIHASKSPADQESLRTYSRITRGKRNLEVFSHGAIVGAVEIVDSITSSQSPWFFGPHGWVIQGRRAFLTPVTCSGMLGFWRPSEDVLMVVKSELEKVW